MVDESRSSDSLAPTEWPDTFRRLVGSAPDHLDAAELEVLAVAAYLHGDDSISAMAWEQAYGRHRADGERAEAARCAFWLALTLLLNGRTAHAGGWLSRAAGAVGDVKCAASGYLLIPALLAALDASDTDAATDLAVEARDGRRRCRIHGHGAVKLVRPVVPLMPHRRPHR